MAMLVLLDSNFRATFRFGSRQLLPVFSEAVQSKVHGAPDRMSLVSQVSYFMRTLPPNSKVALIFGSFENMLTGRRSEIQHFPKAVIRFEVEFMLKCYEICLLPILPSPCLSLHLCFEASLRGMSLSMGSY